MMSSFKIKEVNEMATMLINSDSKRNKDSSMMTLPDPDAQTKSAVTRP
jgi:hypothetical protein